MKLSEPQEALLSGLHQGSPLETLELRGKEFTVLPDPKLIGCSNVYGLS